MLNETELKKALNAGQLKNLYMVFGEEKMLVKLSVEQILKKIGKGELSEFNYHVFDSSADIYDINVACTMISFLSEINVVQLNDMNIDKLKAADFKALMSVIENLPESTVLIFAMPTLELTSKSAGAQAKKLIGYIDKHGCCVELLKRSQMQTERQLLSWAKAGGCEMRGEVADYLIRYVGNNLTILNNEMKKLCAYADGGEITIEMIDELCPKNLEAKIYDLFDYIIAGNSDKSMNILRTLFDLRSEPVYICTVIAGAYVDAYRLRVGAQSGMKPAEIMKGLSMRKPEWAVNKILRQTRNVTVSALRRSLDEITETSVRLISVNTNAQAQVEQLVVKLCLLSQDHSDE